MEIHHRVLSSFAFSLILFVGQSQKDLSKEDYWISPDFAKSSPRVIAVVPMVNMTMDPEASGLLQNEVYQRLQAKGYQKIDSAVVGDVMREMGIQTPEMLSGVSYQRLGKELNCDAVLQGEVNQSGTQHQGIYDSVVVSCSLRLIQCSTGKPLWRCEQFRTAHRQWQLDPFNFLINVAAHEGASRSDRIAWLVQEVFRTLPQGPIEVVFGDLLGQAIEIQAEIAVPMKKLKAQEDPETIRINISSDVLFDFDKYEIRTDAEETMKNLIPIINAFGDAYVTITGHTDSIGTDAYNEDLSLKRAQSCLNWIQQRISRKAQYFQVQGQGSRSPVALNDTTENRQKNRRVELIIKKNK
jgi:outer membrane protein OmpA-like peptidoglycan-associated protein